MTEAITPNIVTVYALKPAEAAAYLIMESLSLDRQEPIREGS